ncbi:MAG: PAS domain-containing protein [Dongiaceae bacterium]
MPSWLEVERVSSWRVIELHDYWQAKRMCRRMPDRADMDPAELKTLLPNILIAEPSFDPFRIRYRLVGTRIARVSSMDFTGRYLDDLLRPEFLADWYRDYTTCHSLGVPVFGASVTPTRDGGTFTYEFGLFPLTQGGDQVAQFIAIEDFGNSEPISGRTLDARKYFD